MEGGTNDGEQQFGLLRVDPSGVERFILRLCLVTTNSCSDSGGARAGG